MNEVILEFLFGSGNYTQAIPVMAIAGIAQGVGSLIGMIGAGKQRREAKLAARQYEADLRRLEANRQDITNPYANMQDLTGMVSNPFANLQVATQAAQMQAEQTDIGLASTLDTLRATGMGAGGATALAREAAASKQGISASIESQEVKNAMLRAQGQQQMEQLQMQSEMRRQELMGSGELQRMSMQEERETAQLDRVSSLAQQYRAQEAQAKSQQNQALGQLVGTAASFGAQALGGAFKPGAQTFDTKAAMGRLSSTMPSVSGIPQASSYSNPFTSAGQSLQIDTNFGYSSGSFDYGGMSSYLPKQNPISAFGASSQFLNTGN